ncbi:Polyprenol reductase 2 [Linum perenne]
MEIGIVGMLRAAWIAGILPLLIASLPFSELGLFQRLVLGFAKRGKIMQNSSYYKLTVPQRFFCHFYVLGVVWTTILLSATSIYAYSTDPSSSSDESHFISERQRYELRLSVFLLVLMEAQVLRRLFETMYVFKYSPSARMHILGYITGLFFYTAAPLSLCCRCASEAFANVVSWLTCGGNGAMRAAIQLFDWWDFVNPLLKLGWLPWIGATMFLWGWIHQRRCHAILGSLRSQGKKIDEYVIPYGDWFELVSSPHYLAEIVIYAAFVVTSGGTDLTIWLLFAFVVVNLAMAAGETHRWYLRKFDTYPRNRFAIIPFVY